MNLEVWRLMVGGAIATLRVLGLMLEDSALHLRVSRLMVEGAIAILKVWRSMLKDSASNLEVKVDIEN